MSFTIRKAWRCPIIIIYFSLTYFQKDSLIKIYSKNNIIIGVRFTLWVRVSALLVREILFAWQEYPETEQILYT